MTKNSESASDNMYDYLLKILLRRLWIVALVALLAGGASCACTYYTYVPEYESSIMLYVNNNKNNGQTSQNITSADLAAAQKLVDSYMVILKTRSTMEQIIDNAHLDIDYQQLQGMIKASAVNATEIFRVTVTSGDPEQAQIIAVAVGDVMTEKMPVIIEGSSVRVVDPPIVPSESVPPNYFRNIILGIIAGIALSAGIILVKELLNKYVTTEDYLRQNYSMPILASIPDIIGNKSKSGYGHYGRYDDYK